MSIYQEELLPQSEEEIRRTKEHKAELIRLNLKRPHLLEKAARALAQRDLAEERVLNQQALIIVCKTLERYPPEQVAAGFENVCAALRVGKQDTIDIAKGENMRRRAPLLKRQSDATEASAEPAQKRHLVILELAHTNDPTGELRKNNCSDIARKVIKDLSKDPRFKTVFNDKAPSHERTRKVIAKKNQK